MNIHDAAGASGWQGGRHGDLEFAHGFALCGGYVARGSSSIFQGQKTQVSGATPGDRFVFTTAGGHTATAPSAAGQVVQRIGVAVSATAINFEPGVPVVSV